MGKICSKCKADMKLDDDKYVNASVWICEECGEEEFACDNQN